MPMMKNNAAGMRVGLLVVLAALRRHSAFQRRACLKSHAQSARRYLFPNQLANGVVWTLYAFLADEMPETPIAIAIRISAGAKP